MGRIVQPAVLPLVLPAVGSFSAIRKGGAKPWTPLDLESKLLAWWDASQGITLAGSQVASWADRKSGYSATQGISSARPVWSATSFGGKPGLTFDGNDDELTCTTTGLLTLLPSGASPSELWAVVQQDAPDADSTPRHVFGYGSVSSLDRRILTRYQGTTPANSRGQLQFGDGSSNRTASLADPLITLSGRHVIRGRYGGDGAIYSQDGNAGSKTSAIPATVVGRVRIGASSQNPAGLFWLGQVRDAVITLPLTTEEAAKLQSFLLARRAL